MFNGVCFKKDKDKSDMNKAIHDFLSYEHTNLIWSSLNTVLCIMPLICLLVINPRLTDSLDLADSKISYTALLIGVCITNIFQFLLRPRLFYPDFKKKLFAEIELDHLKQFKDDDDLN